MFRTRKCLLPCALLTGKAVVEAKLAYLELRDEYIFNHSLFVQITVFAMAEHCNFLKPDPSVISWRVTSVLVSSGPARHKFGSCPRTSALRGSSKVICVSGP